MTTWICLLAFPWTIGAAEPDKLAPGDHTRSLQVDSQTRSYLVHVPPKYDSANLDARRVDLPRSGNEREYDAAFFGDERQG
jgi:poly(3-hydroxybutyrate) depolymerase